MTRQTFALLAASCVSASLTSLGGAIDFDFTAYRKSAPLLRQSPILFQESEL